jgi:fumarate hydratase class I
MANSATYSDTDRYVAQTLLQNAATSAEGVFPACQDTGTASVYGWKGDAVLVEYERDTVDDTAAFASGALATWSKARLRNSQLAPLPGFAERNTGDNSPLSAHIMAVRGNEYRLLFVAKGGGSANKTQLYQETKRILRPETFKAFVEKALGTLGVSACPPYRIAVVLGGQSAEEATLAGKLASAGALDALPSNPEKDGGAYRDRQLEAVVMNCAAQAGWGAQLGGTGMARDARVIRLSRHAASLPVVIAVSCSAHRQVYAYISADGYFVERLASSADLARIAGSVLPALHTAMPNQPGTATGKPIGLELGEPESPAFRARIESLHSGQMVELWGKAVLARDAAHARLLSLIERGEPLPAWAKMPAFYASPTGTPPGAVVGSIGPTTSRRMDSYLDTFMSQGIFMLTIGKGERGPACSQACARYRGAYLATIGGAAALAATRYVASCTVIDWKDLGMEAIRLVEFTGLPAMVAVDPQGNDYYQGLHG